MPYSDKRWKRHIDTFANISNYRACKKPLFKREKTALIVTSKSNDRDIVLTCDTNQNRENLFTY